MDLSNNKHLLKSGLTLAQCKFENRKALTEAFSDKRYATDPEWRDLCGYMANQGFIEDEGKAVPQSTVVDGRTLNRAMSDPAGARKMELEAVARENYQVMFMKEDEHGNLLYHKSPAYREQVRQFLIDNSAAIDAQMPAGALVDRDQPQHRQAFRITLGENSSLYNEIKQGLKDKADAAEKERIAEQHRRVDAGESTDVRDLGGKAV